MSLKIPLRTDLEDYDLQVQLDEVLYTLRLRWNRREQFWYMDVADEGGASVRSSIKVVVDWPLGFGCRHPLWPPGMFSAVSMSSVHDDPRLGELGARVQLLYFSSAELPVDASASIEG